MKIRSGTVAWSILTAYVVGWDYSIARLGKGETLSNAFRRAIHHPFARWPVIVAWGITTLHLFEAFAPEQDPFVYVSRMVVVRPVMERL